MGGTGRGGAKTAGDGADTGVDIPDVSFCVRRERLQGTMTKMLSSGYVWFLLFLTELR